MSFFNFGSSSTPSAGGSTTPLPSPSEISKAPSIAYAPLDGHYDVGSASPIDFDGHSNSKADKPAGEPPGDANPPTRTLWSYVPSWLKPKIAIDHYHSLSDKTLAHLDKIDSTIEKSVASINNFIGTEFIPTELKSLVCVLCDVVSLTLADSPALWAATQPRLLIQYGFLTTAMIDGISYLVKQFIKRVTSPVDQNHGGKESASPTAETMDAISAMFSFIYKYTVGQMPDFVPKELLTKLALANATFMLAKNLEHFGSFLLNLVKGCVDAVWRLVTGRPFFDQGQAEAIKEMAELTAHYEWYLSLKNPKRTQYTVFRNRLTRGLAVHAIAIARGVPEDLCRDFKRTIDSSNAYAAVSAGPLQYSDPKHASIIVSLLGAPGVGKTVVSAFMVPALATACEFEGDVDQMVMVYQKETNFQPTMPKDLRFLVFDDMFLVSDAERFKTIVSTIATLRSPVPILLDDPIASEKGKSYLTPDFVICSDNVIPNDLPATVPEAFARSFTGGVHHMILNPDYTKEGTNHLDRSKLFVDGVQGLQSHLDKAMCFTDHVGVKRTFTGMISSLAALRHHNHFVDRQMEAGIANLRASFKTLAHAVVSNPPTTLERVHASKPVQPIVLTTGASSGEEYADTVDQSLTVDVSFKELKKLLYKPSMSEENNTLLLNRFQVYAKASPDKYVISLVQGSPVLTCQGAVLSTEDVWNKFLPGTVADTVNLDVPPSKWTPEILLAMKKEKFHVFGDCCRHGAYCYRHKTKICDAYDPAALEVGYTGLCHWAIASPDLEPAMRSYHQLISMAYSPIDDTPGIQLLKVVATALLASSIGWCVGMLLSQVFRYYAPTVVNQGLYGNIGPKMSKAKAQVLPLQTYGAREVKDQNLNERPTTWLLNKLSQNTIPVETRTASRRMNLHMLRIIGNLASMNAHAFPEGVTTIRIGGVIATEYPVRRVDHPKDLIPGFLGVQVVTDKKTDDAMLVLPTSLPPPKNILKHLVPRATPIASLTGLIMARQMDSVPDPLHPVECKDSVEFPLGDASSVHHYESSAHYTGVWVRVAVPTVDGDCGNPIFTTNTLVGRGHAQICGTHCGYVEGTKEAVFAPKTHESVSEFIDACPSNVLTMVTAQSRPSIIKPTTRSSPAPTVVLAGELDSSQRQFQNLRNTIRFAPPALANALVGMTYTDPRSGEVKVVPPIDVVPAPIRDLHTPLLKFKLLNTVPDATTYSVFKESIAEVGDHIIAHCDKRLLTPQTELFSIEQAINGCPELGILGLDMKKSPGFQEGFKPGHLGRSLYANQVDDGKWVPTASARLEIESIIGKMKKGKLPNAFVVVNNKVELRPIGKSARTTRAYSFPILVAMRCFSMHVPAVITTGAVTNGMTFGSDLNGLAGREAAVASAEFPHVTSADAKAFDNSKSADFSEPGEKVAARLIHMRFPFLSWDACCTVPMLSRIAYNVFGDLVWFSYHGLISGHPLTTFNNCVDTQGIALTAWKRTDPGEDHQYWTSAFSQSYGDDLRVAHNNVLYDAFNLVKTGALLGIEYTPLSKDGDHVAPFVAQYDDTHLKRFPWQDVNGQFHYPLRMDVLNHIHAFYHTKDRDHRGAWTQAVDSSLREWFQYKKVDFEEASRRLNLALRELDCQPVNLRYDDLFAGWMKNQGGSHMHRLFSKSVHAAVKPLVGTLELENATAIEAIVVDQSTTELIVASAQKSGDIRRSARFVRQRSARLTPVVLAWRPLDYYKAGSPWAHAHQLATVFEVQAAREARDLTLDLEGATRRWDHVYDQSSEKIIGKAALTSTDPELNSTTSSLDNPNSGTQVSSTSGVVTQHKLTKYVDNSVLSTSEPTAAVAKSAKTELNPYPPTGVEDILCREYPIATITWLTADGAGTRYPAGGIQFPEVMFGIPNISEKLSSFRYIRAGVKYTIRVNGNQFVAGALLASFVPYHTNEVGSNDLWRSDHNLLMNSPGHIISASKADAVSAHWTWKAPNTWYDIQQLQPQAGIGMLFIDVAVPITWVSSAAPTSLTAKVFAQFTDVQLAGMDVNIGPTLTGVEERKLRELISRLKFEKGKNRAETIEEALSNATHRGDVVRDQSASKEAEQKSSKGIISDVGSAAETVSSFVGAIEKVATVVGSILDKPTTVQAPVPMYYRTVMDMLPIKGLSQNLTYAQDPEAYVSKANEVSGEASPQPCWDEILTLPGVIDYLTFPATGVSAGTVIYHTIVDPCKCYLAASGLYVPTPLAYYAMYHHYWHGDIKYLFRFFSPSVQKAQVRITYLPSTSATTGVADDVVGDVETCVHDIVGDTDIPFVIRFLSRNKQLVVTAPDGSVNNPLTAFGRIVVQVVTPISSNIAPNTAPIRGIVYSAAAPGFVLDVPRGLPANWAVVYLPSDQRAHDSSSVFGAVPTARRDKVRDQSSVRDLFGTEFSPLSPSKGVSHSGLCDPDKSRGPVEMAKRYVFTNVYPIDSSGTAFYAIPQGPMADLLSPFKSWSGGINYKFLVFNEESSTASYVIVRREEASGEVTGSFQGTSFYTLFQDPSIGLTMPYSQPNHITPFFNDHVENDDTLTYILQPDASINVGAWMSAADDFSVYHFMAPPFLSLASSSTKKSNLQGSPMARGQASVSSAGAVQKALSSRTASDRAETKVVK